MEQKFIPTDFGMISTGDVPDEYTAPLRTDERFIKLCSDVYCVGGNVGSGPARLVRQPLCDENGLYGWSVNVVIPFTGEFYYEVSREEFSK